MNAAQNAKELGLFLRLWLSKARESNPETRWEILDRPRVTIITEDDPTRMSTFMLDWQTFGKDKVGVYRQRGSVNSWVGTLHANEEGMVVLLGRGAGDLTQGDAIRLLRTFKESVEYAMVLATQPKFMGKGVVRTSKEELATRVLPLFVKIADRVKSFPEMDTARGAVLELGKYRVSHRLEGFRAKFALRHIEAGEHADSNSPVLLFEYNIKLEANVEITVYEGHRHDHIVAILQDFAEQPEVTRVR